MFDTSILIINTCLNSKNCDSGPHQSEVAWCLQSFAASSQAPHASKLAFLEQKHDDEDFYICSADVNTVKVLSLIQWLCPITILLCA